jgi:hypothetical protein
MSYVPPQASMTRDDWPTLKEMLDAGQRVVVFMDKGAEDGAVPYILPQFDLVCSLPFPGIPFFTDILQDVGR